MQDSLPGRTAWESEQYRRDHGRRAAVVRAHRALADLIEADEDCPIPPGNDIVVAAALSREAVDRFAARHHVTAAWNGRVYKAEVILSPELKFCVIHIPARSLDEHLDSEDAEDAGELVAA